MVDLIEELLEVNVYYPFLAFAHITTGSIDRVMGGTIGTKSIAVLAH